MVALLPRIVFLFALAASPAEEVAVESSPAALPELDLGRIGRSARQIALVRTRRLGQVVDFLRPYRPEPARRLAADLSAVQDDACALYFLAARGCRDRDLLASRANRLVRNLEQLAERARELASLPSSSDPPGLTPDKLRSSWELFSLDVNQSLASARELEADCSRLAPRDERRAESRTLLKGQT